MGSETPTRRWWAVIRSLLSITVALAALALFLAWMGGAFHEKVHPGHSPLERPALGERKTVTVERRRSQDVIVAVGSVQPKRKTEVASRLLAGILEVNARPGETVKLNDILVVLDDRELLTQQREAAASLTAAEADLVVRKTDYERIRKLASTSAVSEEEASRILGAFRVAESQVRRAKEVIARLDVQLTYTKIRATADGLVTDRMVEPGDLAAPGKPLLAIYDPRDLELHVNVPESVSASLSVNRSLPFEISAAGLRGKGTIREIVPQAEQTSRAVLVKVSLPPTTVTGVLPGMFGRVSIPVGEVERLWLPVDAVQRIGQLELVEVVDRDNRLTRRFVRTGHVADGSVEILSGLSEGERVALPSRG